MRVLRFICRMVLGATFVFSGFVKAVDPWGFAYKLQDYFAAFSMGWLSGLALALAVILSWAELLLGVLLLVDELRPIAVWGVTGFMAFFTPLTLYLAIANPVSDCGCFGDALILSNWQTFSKNLVLLAATLFLLLGSWHKTMWRFRFKPWRQMVLWGILGLLCLYPAIHALRHLPLIDFRPYHVGANLPEGMRVPEDAPQDVYETRFVYEKDGVQQEFTEANYPWEDSTWHYVSSETTLVAKGYEPPIKDFYLRDSTGQDITDQLLTSPEYQLLAVSPFIEDINGRELQQLQAFATMVTAAGYPVALATSSPIEQQQLYQQKGLTIPIYTGDERVLKTVVRAAPGVVLLHRGTVVAKWALRDVPESDFFKGDLIAAQLSTAKATQQAHWFWIILGVVLLTGAYLTSIRAGEREAIRQSQK